MTPNMVCVIDDDRIFQVLIKRMLEREKLSKKILVFSDGEDAFHYFNENIETDKNLPDVVFLDLNMPYMDGWDFLEEYVNLRPRIRKQITIYIVSSSNSELDRRKAEKFSEVSDYIVKPVSADGLKQLILAHSALN